MSQSHWPTHDAPELVEHILRLAWKQSASDIHFEPIEQGYQVRFRIDGLLQTAGLLDTSLGRAAVNRLMVLAQLLTYRLDIPQEGRLALSIAPGQTIDLRLAIVTTLHGLRAVIRLPEHLSQPKRMDELGLPEPVLEGLRRFAHSDSGLLLLTGPAGSGKTTTIYALLSHIVQTQPGLSVITLEDPIERALENVTQIQVQPFGQLTYERALRSVVRQDPQVLMIGEIRDAQTASLVIQASLSGHRMISTLHAGTPAGAIARLLEMGLEPYQITNSLYGVVAQRLARKLDPQAGGYRGRIPIAAFAPMSTSLRQAVLHHSDLASLNAAIDAEPGCQTLRHAADEAVRAKLTDQDEILRVLGAAN